MSIVTVGIDLAKTIFAVHGLCQLVEIETEPPQVRHSFRSRSTDFGLLR